MITAAKKHRSLGSVTVEYSLVMAITITIVVAAAQAMNPNMESFFEAAANKIESFLSGGSSSNGGGIEKTSQIPDVDAYAADRDTAARLRLEAAQGGEDSGGGGGFLGTVWGGIKQVGGFFKGVGEQGWDTVVGLGTLAYDAHRLTTPFAIVYEIVDPEGQAALRNKYVQVGRAIWNNPGDVAYAIVEPIVTDWENGNYGEAIGRGTFEAVTIIFTPTKLGKVGKIGDVAEDVASAARAADRVDDLSDAGSVAGRVDEAGNVIDDVAHGNFNPNHLPSQADVFDPRLPARKPPGTKPNPTHGITEVNGQEVFFKSGVEGPGSRWYDPSKPAINQAATHVEGHAAATMIDNGITDMTITINNRSGPCGNCLRQIPDLLPEGSTLNVRWIDADGNVHITPIPGRATS